MAALPFDSIVEVTFRGLLLGQRCLNVFHYRVFVTSTKPTVADEMQALTASILAGVDTTILADILAVLPGNYNMQQIVAQPIRLLRYRRSVRSVTATGGRADSEVSNIQASITLQTDFSGRSQIGGKRFAMTPGDAVGGMVNAGLFGLLVGLATTIRLPIIVTDGGGTYAPTIYHRGQAVPISTDITASFAQATTRVIRRRTLGLGE